MTPMPATSGAIQAGTSATASVAAPGATDAAALGAGAWAAPPGATDGLTPPADPAHAAGTGPDGAGCGPYWVGCFALTSASQASPKAVMSTPSAALNASSSVRPSAYERMSPTRASV